MRKVAAEINFLPVCSNCRHILDDQEIDCVESAEEYKLRSQSMLITRIPPQIIPAICPRCKSSFLTIAMPTRLPFPAQRKGVSFFE